MILMYHKVDLNSRTMWWVTAHEFYRQMVELSSKEVVYLDDYDVNNPNQVVITFDGIYKNVHSYAMPILKHFNYPFELFLTSQYIGNDNSFDSVEPLSDFTTEDELRELVENGGRLQWHTISHPNLKEVTDVNFIAKELTVPENIKALDEKGFTWFAYPHGEFNDVVLEETKKRFTGAVSCHQGGNRNNHLLDRLTVVNETKLNTHKVACIIASYNYGDFLIEAVESVLKQTILPNEILITDDCSDDDTQSIAEAYAKKYPDLIKYNRNETNLGIVQHFNRAISLTSSEYVMFLGADNRLVSNYVEECVKVLDSNDKVAIAYTDYALFGSRAKHVYDEFDESRKGEIKLDTYYQINFPDLNTYEEISEEIGKGNFIQGSSMYRRSVFDAIGGYKKSSSAEDFNLFKRIISEGWLAKKASNTNLEYRQHSAYQANNVVGLYQKVQFYKRLYEQKAFFEKTRWYKLSYKSYLGYRFIKLNYKNPKRILKFIYKKLRK